MRQEKLSKLNTYFNKVKEALSKAKADNNNQAIAFWNKELQVTDKKITSLKLVDSNKK